MSQSPQEKRARFARVAVPRVEAAVDLFRKIGNCSIKSKYEWDQLKWKKVFVHILVAIQDCAELFKIKIEFTINGVDSRNLYDETALEAFLDEV